MADPDREPYPPWTGRLGSGLLVGAAALVLLAVLAVVLAEATHLDASRALHVQVEYFAVFAAISIFFLASAKYTLSREPAYLPLGLGFLAAAVLDLAHPLLPSGPIPVEALPGIRFEARDLDGYLWWAGRLAVGLGFFGAALRLQRPGLDAHPARRLLRGLVGTLAGVTVLASLLALLPLAPYYGAGRIGPGLELVPLALFAGVGFLLLRDSQGRGDVLPLVGASSLGLAGVAQIFAALAASTGDALFVTAHLFKVAGYLVVLFGLYFEHVNLYARERRLRNKIEDAEREALRRRAELFAVIENTSDGIAILDKAGVLLHLNRAGHEILGSRPGESWIGTPLVDHVLGAGQRPHDAVATALHDALHRGEGSRAVDVEFTRGGRSAFFSVGVAPLRDAHDQIQGAVVDLHDVTVLRQAERRYRELTEGAPDGIIELDDAGKIEFFNRAAETIFGFEKHEMLGRPIDVILPGRLRGVGAGIQALRGPGDASRAGTPVELPALRKDGREIVVELSIARREGPRPQPLTAVIRDVQPLQRSRREKDALVAIARAVNASEDVRGLCAEAAPSLREGLRYDSILIFVKSPARPVLELLGAARPDRAASAEKGTGIRIEPGEAAVPVRAFRTGEAIVTGPGEPSPDPAQGPLAEDGLVLTVPIVATNNALGVIVGATSTRRHDRNEELATLQTVALQLGLGISQKLLVQELRDTARSLSVTNRELDSFIYTASHDLAEPLRSMANFSQFLTEDYAQQLDEHGKDYLKRIHEGAIRMRGLLDALLQVSRIRHKPLPFEALDPARLLHDVRESLDAMIRERQAEVVVNGPMPRVVAQPQRLFEVFTNLITNGLKFNEAVTPRVEISAAERDGFVEFAVRDNGIGIPEKYQDRVFGLFTRLHPRGQYPGTGAGLAIVRTIVEQHQGQVRLQSKEGAGTTVTFTVPREAAA